MSADLHIHSTYSDGSFPPEQLVKMAKENGLSTIALADHDTVEGVPEMIALGKEMGIEVIPAIEFSTVREKAEVHILGYYMDYRSRDFLKRVEAFFTARLDRAREMVNRLNQLGINIHYEDVTKLAGDKYIGRPHLAMALKQAGYIKETDDAYTNELIGNEGKAYVPKFQLKPVEAISIIKKAGGIAVLAHPYFINRGKPFGEEEIKELTEYGLDGLEVYHSKHSEKTSQYYLEIAEKLNLLVTGGSDFHGENTPGIQVGDVRIDDQRVKKLKDYLGIS